MNENTLEQSDQYISLARAAELAGLAPTTLRNQVRRKRLRAVKIARNHLTTRRWLHDYLTARDDLRKHVAPLPPGYVAPE